MRLLVLGGTRFLSRAVAADAVARGHDVVCAARGESGEVPSGATLVRWDRDQPPPSDLLGRPVDAVVDVARHPSRVASALAALPEAHWVFVSTISVYADDATPGGRPGTLPLREPVRTDVDPMSSVEAYGGMKVACEQLVRDAAASATVVRPGLIVGPGDPTGRFTYWVRRLADAAHEAADDGPVADVLAPGDPADLVQLVDVRDLAAWLVDCARRRLVGDFDAVGPARPIAEVLTDVASGVDAEPRLVWVPRQELERQGVEPWAGPDSLPLWLPRPEYDGMLAHDATPCLEAGLTVRPLADTTRATLRWLEQTPDATVTGIDRTREAALLAAWTHRPA